MSQQTQLTVEKNYRFSGALRPFSLFIALSTTGIVFARLQDQPNFSLGLAWLVVLGAALAQVGVNLINDWSERHQFPKASAQYRNINLNFRIACLCFGVAIGIGLLIATVRGFAIILMAGIGLIACLGYTLEPLNLKRRGLGLVVVFLVMGPLLMVGSAYAMTGEWRADVLIDALIFSPLISLVLLANELRDYERDKFTPDQTFTVRVGFKPARYCFLSLTLATALAYLAAILKTHLQPTLIFILPLTLAIWIVVFCIRSEQAELFKLPPLTGRLVLATGTAHIFALLGTI